MKKYGTIPKSWILLNNYSFRTLIYYGKNYDTKEKNYGAVEKINCTMEKTMLRYRKLWNFDLLWQKVWYYGKNYDTIVNYS